eukprot:CAMPEP_0115303532 /NCGR_PEP_ID=MMETSP0270-20121206/70970_1 /TAXON_ID=71861 /ORGANISM="Scrippsiella trochoidea, Strain CCMP3099" /LENGTH=50 /DNA_ID=CAMNT_0002721539 /DNA_START=109 /DNA_END=261 /DNA_ORIENTATION=+
MYNELVHGALASGTWGRRWQPPVEALPHGEGGRPLAPTGGAVSDVGSGAA